MNNTYVLLMVLAAFLAAVSQVLLKVSAGREHKGLLGEYLNGYVITGYGLLALSLLMNMWAYQGVEYRFGPVINAVSYVFVLILGRLFLKEKITARKLLGNVLIICGIVVYVMWS
ncbi:MAG: EamA family transporter [Lachnospiraceae bacterium]|nr:EamA family transporter [Lachnospiraceae bacterium]